VTARRGVFWPLILIAIGLVFLLANFGLIAGVSWLAILNLWPLLLVLVGLDIAFARRWPIPTLVAEVAVIAAGLALVAATPSYGGIFAFGSARQGVTEASAPRTAGTTQLDVTINGGAGTYRVSGGATDLVEAHSANPDLRVVASERQGRATVRLDQVGPEHFPFATGAVDIQVQIASDVPTSFNMNAGAGTFDVDLSGVRVADARVSAGASSMHLTLPKPSADVPVRVNAGASTVEITVPDGVEARIGTTGGILSLRSDNARFSDANRAVGCLACGTSVESSGYAAATSRVTVTISAGASSIVVR
jgi:Domain of unknown function (DUF5668)